MAASATLRNARTLRRLIDLIQANAGGKQGAGASAGDDRDGAAG